MDFKKVKESKSFLKFIFLILIFVISAFASIFGAPPVEVYSDIKITKYFGDIPFERPVDLLSPPDDSNRLFVVSQTGKIIVFDNKKSISTFNVFFDISDQVLSSGEMGLLGLTFHPNFENNQRFYIYYNEINSGNSKIVQYQTEVNDNNKANLSSALLILEQPQPYGNHNGGQIRFGPDNYLYISLGDGGSSGDPHGNGQNRSTLLGSILRINVTESSIESPYTIPEDNSFVNNSVGYREEIFAYGLRNVWRYSFDSLTGNLWGGDVGQNAIEEIDIIVKGENYGWNTKEGFNCYNPSSGCDSTDLIDPIYQYDRAEGFSITGGYVYRGTDILSLNGSYIYGDYISGKIWSLKLDDQGNVENKLLFETNINITAFGIDKFNELYILDHIGDIYKFEGNI